MLREPWFEILSITEPAGRSVADIVAGCVRKHRVSLKEMRGAGQSRYVTKARRQTVEAIVVERPDLASRHIASFLNRDPSTIRHMVNKLKREAAA